MQMTIDDNQDQRARDQQILIQCAELRAKRRYSEAIEQIEDCLDQFHPELYLKACYEAFFAAKAKGDTETAKKYVLAIYDASTEVRGSA